jgi:hypothetical protein
MDEARWDRERDLTVLAGWLRRHRGVTLWSRGRRLLRLLGCAFCRRVWDLLGEVPFREAVETAERYADRQAHLSELIEAATRAGERRDLLFSLGNSADQPQGCAAHAAVMVACSTSTWPAIFGRWSLWTMVELAASSAAWAVGQGAYHDPERGRWLAVQPLLCEEETVMQAHLLRDIFGNPFRPLTPLPSGVSKAQKELIRNMAAAAYQERSFADLPVLADVLEEAGCSDAELLAHCRMGGPHTRGCWAVDLVLGRRGGR